MQPGFKVIIDGREHGPYPVTDRKKFKNIVNLKGVEFRNVYITDEESRKQKAESRKQLPIPIF